MHSLSYLLSLSLAVTGALGAIPQGWGGGSSFKIQGTSGVAAMQMVVTTESKVIFIDRVENNPLKKGKNPVWGSELTLSNNGLRALAMQTNSFCAGGSFMGDGTLVSLGGDANTQFGAKNGLQGLRLFTPCDNGKCEIREDPSKMRLDTPRWYPGTTRIQDGSILIAGGVSETDRMTDNPTIEFYPRKGNGKSIYSPFLHNALPWNLFPHIITMPNSDSTVFMASDSKVAFYNWKTNTYQNLPDMPNNQVVTYPYSAAAALLPLRASNGYTPEVIFCGGTQIKPGQGSNPNTPASNQCSRMVLTTAGIAAGWQVESMPERRMMGNFINTPDGKLVLLNGAGSGTAGYYDKINSFTNSYSSASNPTRNAWIYDPDQPVGQRWYQLATSQINRMYHSVASLLPDGRIISAGSNPNPQFNSGGPYPTEMRIDYLQPAYLNKPRPTVSGVPAKISFGATLKINVSIPTGADLSTLTASVMDFGFSTHGVNYSQRHVQLTAVLAADGKSLTVTAPPNSNVYPRGPAYFFITVEGIPSVGVKLSIG